MARRVRRQSPALSPERRRSERITGRARSLFVVALLATGMD